MRKIENIIDDCKNCKHYRSLMSTKGTSFFAAICAYSTDYEEEKEVPNMLLNTSIVDSKHYTLDIPDNCPLETYKELER